MKCPKCGKENGYTSMHCYNCGARLPIKPVVAVENKELAALIIQEAEKAKRNKAMQEGSQNQQAQQQDKRLYPYRQPGQSTKQSSLSQKAQQQQIYSSHSSYTSAKGE